MIIQLTRSELLKIENYLMDERKAHPIIFGAVVNALKTHRPSVSFSVTLSEYGLIKKILNRKNPRSKVKAFIKNPLSKRTKLLRELGAIKEDEWIGGNDFHRVHPKVSRFHEAEKYGQLRMELNPKKRKRKKKVKNKK